MRLLDISCDDPARNLALDEALLDEAEAGRSGEMLRFWESPVHFVVLGLTQVLTEEVYEEQCAADGIAILRRCSAGGCVLQGPGCLNFALVLEHGSRPELGTIRASYEYILGRLVQHFDEAGVSLCVDGTSDLSLGEKKVSGNAQRRRRKFILHHGTLLFDTDLGLVSRYLREPKRRPVYRGDRSHADFLRNIPLERSALMRCVAEAFRAGSPSSPRPGEWDRTLELVDLKYDRASWTHRH